MSDLRSRAAAGRIQPTGNGTRGGADTGQAEPIIIEEVGEDPEAVHVKVAWARAMRFCRALSKGSTARVTNKEGKLLYTYQYRGIDDVVTLAGMAFRQFGVMVMPVEVVTEYRPGHMKECHVLATYEITSLGEGTMRATIRSEGMDLGDKSTVKAEQQAFRIFLTTALCLPTYDPTMDSDATPLTRPEPPSPLELRDHILDPNTSAQQLKARLGELKRDPDLAATKVPVGDEQVTLWDLCTRTGKARETVGGA